MIKALINLLACLFSNKGESVKHSPAPTTEEIVRLLQVEVTLPNEQAGNGYEEDGLTLFIKKHGKPEWLIPQGVTSPNCPHCEHEFEKMPQRKRKCPSCKETFYSWKRPIDFKKSLLTDEHTKEVWYQNRFQNMTYEEITFFVEFHQELSTLRQANKIPLGDLLWHGHNKLQLNCLRSSKFYSYAIYSREMSEQRIFESNNKSALPFFIIFNYLMMNEVSDNSPHFTSESKIDRNRFIQVSSLTDEYMVSEEKMRDLKKVWGTEATVMEKRHKLTISPEQSWISYWEKYNESLIEFNKSGGIEITEEELFKGYLNLG